MYGIDSLWERQKPPTGHGGTREDFEDRERILIRASIARALAELALA
jgi:hypothetical protein